MAEHWLNSTAIDVRREEEAEKRENRNQYLTWGTPGSALGEARQGRNHELWVGGGR